MITVTRKTAFRQTATQVRDGSKPRAVLVALEPGVLVLRLKRTRTEYRVPWGVIYLRAVQAEVESRRPRRRRPIQRGTIAQQGGSR